MHNSELDNKIICYLGGALSAPEREAFEQQLLTDAQAQSRLDEVRALWTSAEVQSRREMLESRREEVWDGIARRTTRRFTIGRVVRGAMRVAAVVVPLVALGLVGTHLMQPADRVTYTAAAERLTLTLPDSSEVILNSNSELTYWTANGSRRAELNGMALFSIRRNEALPFVVTAADAQVEVLGTRFTVENIEERQRVRVDVEEGLVAFTAGDETRKLAARDYATWRGGQMFAGRHTSCHSSWTSEKIEFRDATLAGVAYELMSYYTEIKGIKGNLASDTTRVTTSFSHQPLSEVIEELNIHYNEKIAMDNGFLVISD